MLRMIPRHPKKIDPPALKAALEREGYSVDLRSVQRDLQKLSLVFPLLKDDHRPSGWSWQGAAPPFDVPGMDPHTAIAFQLVEKQLQHQLPRTTLDALKPHFVLAKHVLESTHGGDLLSWNNKVHVTPRSQRLHAPSVDPVVLGRVYDALLEGTCLSVSYRNRSDKQSQGIINPLGLVFRDSLPLVVCTWAGFEGEVRQLAMQRIEKADIHPAPCQIPTGFDLRAYVASGETSFKLTNKPITVVARFAPEAARSVVETPLALDQKVTLDDDGWTRVVALVDDTRVLRAWLLSFGPLVEIVKPTALRRATAEAIRAAAKWYADD